MVYHSDNEITFFFIKSWNKFIYLVYFKSKKELNYDRFADPNTLGASRLVHSDLRIYRISFFLLDVTNKIVSSMLCIHMACCITRFHPIYTYAAVKCQNVVTTQQTRHILPMLVQCWVKVVDNLTRCRC